LFSEQEDYSAFLSVVAEARAQKPMRILAYCLMPNHWHFLLWPSEDGAVSLFMQWLTGTHASRWRRHTGTRGQGAVYQSRFVDVAILDSAHLLSAWKYVERNPVEAGLVERAEQWPWSSAAHRSDPENAPLPLDPPPFPLPVNWEQYVNEDLLLPPTELAITL
jgi:putative transposase